MKRIIFLLFPILLFHFSLTAQSDNVQKGWAAVFSAALIPISQPGLGLQPGIEYRFNNRYSLLTDIVIPVNKKDSKDSSELNKKYFRVKSELRYHFLNRKSKSSRYAGLQIARASRSFINNNSFYYDEQGSDSGYYYSSASVNSPVTTVSLQFGSIFSIKNKRLVLDLFAGIGARFINTSITDIKDPVRAKIAKPSDGPSFTASYSYSGNVTMLHLNGGIRLMWHFYDIIHPQKQ